MKMQEKKYRADSFADIEKKFGLETAEVVNVPYNKLLNQLGRLRSMPL